VFYLYRYARKYSLFMPLLPSPSRL